MKKATRKRRAGDHPTVGEMRRLDKENVTDAQLKALYGRKWRKMRAMLADYETSSMRTMNTGYAWVAEWVARVPQQTTKCVFELFDIISMIQYNGASTPDEEYKSWGQAIAKAIREGHVSELHALANYVEKLQKCRPKKTGEKLPWPDHAEDLAPPTSEHGKRVEKVAQAVRDIASEGIAPTRPEVSRRAKEKTNGGNFTKIWSSPGLNWIKKGTSGPKVPTSKASKKR